MQAHCVWYMNKGPHTCFFLMLSQSDREGVLADGITIQIKKNKLANSYIFPCHSNAKGFFNIMFKVWSECPHKYH